MFQAQEKHRKLTSIQSIRLFFVSFSKPMIILIRRLNYLKANVFECLSKFNKSTTILKIKSKKIWSYMYG